jgi:hypothetical protein
MMVVCPPGVRAGQLLEVATPHGDELQFPVPDGIQPGQSFPIQYMDGRQSEAVLQMPEGGIPENNPMDDSDIPVTTMLKPQRSSDPIHATVSQAPSKRKMSGYVEEKPKYAGLRKKPETVSFAFENLGLSVRSHDGKPLKVLKGVTGEIKARQLVAVMGPSGAGKTTFMVSALLPHGSLFVDGLTLDTFSRMYCPAVLTTGRQRGPSPLMAVKGKCWTTATKLVSQRLLSAVMSPRSIEFLTPSLCHFLHLNPNYQDSCRRTTLCTTT